MKMLPSILVFLSGSVLCAADGDWPRFRGEAAQGVAEGYALPAGFDLKTGEGVKWRAAVPGLGLSSPVIAGNKLFITAAVSSSDSGALRTGLYGDVASVQDDSEHVWKVLAYDKHSGELLWSRDIHRGVPAVKRHAKSSHASASVAVEGDRLVAFIGSEGLYCLDLDGNVVWNKTFGTLDVGWYVDPAAQWEFANSPVIHNGVVIALADAQVGGFLAAFRLSDGEQIWRVDRKDVPTWGAPLVVVADNRTQVVVNGWRHAGGYDFETGEELWRVNGGGDLPVPSPIYSDGRFYLTSAHGDQAPVYAVSAKRRGTTHLTQGQTLGLEWVVERKGAYMATPLLLDGLLYVVRWNGILVCLNPKNGGLIYEKRLPPGAYTASLVGGDGKIYIANEDGAVIIVRAGRKFSIASETQAEDPILASPALSQGVIYLRTGRELIAVGE